MNQPNVRVWDKEKQQMVYEFTLTSKGVWVDKQDPSTYVLLRHTELTDKEETPIYEGDIVTVVSTYKGMKGNDKPTTFTGVVSYQAPNFYVGGFYFAHYDDPCDAFERMEQVTVIGNQFEHAHLIKESTT